MSSFENWKEEYGLQSEPNYSEHTDKDCKSAFEAGQQSQQAKIDELQKQVITQGQNFNDQAQKLKDTEYFNQKLQARVDSLTNINESLVAYKNQLLDELEEKGNKDEN